MSFAVDVQNDNEYALDISRLRQAAETVLTRHNAEFETAMSIVITDDAAIAELNCQHRGIDAPTDVLSFPADEPPVEVPDEPPYLGDLVIAYPYAAAQAAREGHDLNDSLSLLVVHGTLHLLGFDHDTDMNREAMWSAQADALIALNISSDIVPALERGSIDEPPREDH
jgi:probable rRNA maturation factor